MRSPIFSALLAMTVLASCESEEGRLTGTWQGGRFETDVWTLTLDDSHGRLSGTYQIQWGEEPSEVSGSLTGSSLQTSRDFLDVLIEFNVEIAAGTATCRFPKQA